VKICPYAWSGALANSDWSGALAANSELLPEVLDAQSVCEDYPIVRCFEEKCGRYAACNPQVQIDYKLDNFMGSNLSTRAKRILARALSKYSDTEVKRMPEHKWLRFDDCGEGTTKEILNYLHGREDDA
jgi:hypothetical protein